MMERWTTIEFKEWTSTDRKTRVLATSEFLEHFLSTLNKLRTHDFIAKIEAQFLRDTKDKLQHWEILAIADFSSVVVHDEIQNVPLDKHPGNSACYHHDGHHLCFLVISECLVPDTVAVHLAYSFFGFSSRGKAEKDCIHVRWLFSAVQELKKISACYHFQDFGVEAEWHFFATSRGKSAGDGAGGALKRLAIKASLQHPYNNQILTAQDLRHQ